MPLIKLHDDHIRLYDDLNAEEQRTIMRELSEAPGLLNKVSWYEFEEQYLKDYYDGLKGADWKDITAFISMPAYVYSADSEGKINANPTLVQVPVAGPGFDDVLNGVGRIIIGGCFYFDVRTPRQDYSITEELAKIDAGTEQDGVLFKDRFIINSARDVYIAKFGEPAPPEKDGDTPTGDPKDVVLSHFRQEPAVLYNRVLINLLSSFSKIDKAEVEAALLEDRTYTGEITPFEIERFLFSRGVDYTQENISSLVNLAEI